MLGTGLLDYVYCITLLLVVEAYNSLMKRSAYLRCIVLQYNTSEAKSINFRFVACFSLMNPIEEYIAYIILMCLVYVRTKVALIRS